MESAFTSCVAFAKGHYRSRKQSGTMTATLAPEGGEERAWVLEDARLSHCTRGVRRRNWIATP